jgi:hypothetical protein
MSGALNPAAKPSELSPGTELVVAALQFLNHGAPARQRLAEAVLRLPAPLAMLESDTLLTLRQAAARAVRLDGAGGAIVGGRRGAGLARVLLDNALRAHCRHLRGGAAFGRVGFGQLLGQVAS